MTHKIENCIFNALEMFLLYFAKTQLICSGSNKSYSHTIEISLHLTWDLGFFEHQPDGSKSLKCTSNCHDHQHQPVINIHCPKI